MGESVKPMWPPTFLYAYQALLQGVALGTGGSMFHENPSVLKSARWPLLSTRSPWTSPDTEEGAVQYLCNTGSESGCKWTF